MPFIMLSWRRLHVTCTKQYSKYKQCVLSWLGEDKAVPGNRACHLLQIEAGNAVEQPG